MILLSQLALTLVLLVVRRGRRELQAARTAAWSRALVRQPAEVRDFEWLVAAELAALLPGQGFADRLERSLARVAEDRWHLALAEHRLAEARHLLDAEPRRRVPLRLAQLAGLRHAATALALQPPRCGRFVLDRDATIRAIQLVAGEQAAVLLTAGSYLDAALDRGAIELVDDALVEVCS